MALPEGIERRKVWLIGLDQVTVSGAENIRKVLDSGDVERPITETRKLGDLPLWARWFFPVTRFYNERFGWFLAFISEADAAYCPCRTFLDSKFENRAFLDEDVTAAADLLQQEEPASDDALVKVFVQAIQRSFTPVKLVPETVLQAANGQISNPVDSFLPWKRLPSAWGTSAVFGFGSECRKDISGAAELPDRCVMDISHVVLALQKNGPAILRAAAANPELDTGVLFARTSPNTTAETVRMVSKRSTLGGLLPESDPALPGKTLVSVAIASAAVATDNVLWALGTGTQSRVCAAKPALLDFTRAVQQELKRRRDSA